ncbi:M23 family metallopeptidase [Vibrio parahaemolyticus]|nr:M23 family metallopeptidase [Vibrio parahaemolyticus]HCE2588743.1 M23 family metallopeptidase [Vibrio parahaemolyticus]HCG8728500.1 M23 family metallopeptidase [Vibrio parahaemolyticus]HCH1696916.1 M23 family metallopeptidase [Vibrio parahaemolyticus]HCM0405871.1 M23 family metallopeptidase [Vibrio parahaemolyticus]
MKQMNNANKVLRFPLKTRPAQSYTVAPRSFGSNRSNGRKHAGCDLYAPAGTEILSMLDGKVVNIYSFYLGTKAIEVDHGIFLARYGEISDVVDGIKVGSMIKRGDVIAKVGTLKFKNGETMSMLHLELYSKSQTGPLTVRDNLPYKRRSDLMDPTNYLNSAHLK